MAETQIEFQNSNQSQEKQIRLYYFDHDDDFFSEKKIPLFIKVNDVIFNGFVKIRYHGRDMYYVFHHHVYIKLWKDTKGHILIYIDSIKVKERFYSGVAEVVIPDRMYYDPQTNILQCGSMKVKLSGFELYNVLLKLEPELINPTFAVICNKLI